MQKVHPKPTSFGLDGFLWGPDASRVKADTTSDRTILSTCSCASCLSRWVVYDFFIYRSMNGPVLIIIWYYVMFVSWVMWKQAWCRIFHHFPRLRGPAEVLPCFKPCRGRRAPKTVLHVGTLTANECKECSVHTRKKKIVKQKRVSIGLSPCPGCNRHHQVFYF